MMSSVVPTLLNKYQINMSKWIRYRLRTIKHLNQLHRAHNQKVNKFKSPRLKQLYPQWYNKKMNLHRMWKYKTKPLQSLQLIF